jgi:hypothetical protein
MAEKEPTEKQDETPADDGTLALPEKTEKAPLPRYEEDIRQRAVLPVDQRRAAFLASTGRYSRTKIAALCGVSIKTLHRWLKIEDVQRVIAGYQRQRGVEDLNREWYIMELLDECYIASGPQRPSLWRLLGESLGHIGSGQNVNIFGGAAKEIAGLEPKEQAAFIRKKFGPELKKLNIKIS